MKLWWSIRDKVLREKTILNTHAYRNKVFVKKYTYMNFEFVGLCYLLFKI